MILQRKLLLWKMCFEGKRHRVLRVAEARQPSLGLCIRKEHWTSGSRVPTTSGFARVKINHSPQFNELVRAQSISVACRIVNGLLETTLPSTTFVSTIQQHREI
jgi:hypothetical protein